MGIAMRGAAVSLLWLLACVPGMASAQLVSGSVEASLVDASTERAELSKLILYDLEFVLLTWKTAGPRDRPMERWLSETQTRLFDLKTIARQADLDQQVLSAIEVAEKMLADYGDLVDNLNAIDVAVNVGKTDEDRDGPGLIFFLQNAGEDSLAAGIGAAAGAALGIPAAAATGVVLAIQVVVDEYQYTRARDSRFAKLDQLKDASARKAIESTQRKFNDRLSNLVSVSKMVGERLNIGVPDYSLSSRSREQNPSPFGKVLRAYDAINAQKWTEAAAAFVQAAQAIPERSGEIEQIYATRYRAPYYLLAAHLSEFQALHSARGVDSEAAKLAVQSYAAAVLELHNDALPYSYRVSHARALAMQGQTTVAVRMAQEIANQTSSTPTGKAARLYDAAGIFALAGNADQAMQALRASFKAFPRRDRYAYNDPQFALLRQSHGRALKELTDHPLVGGRWLLAVDHRRMFRFYPDGFFFQSRLESNQAITELSGQWITGSDNVLLLTDRRDVTTAAARPDASMRYELDPQARQLTVVSPIDGQPLKFNRNDDNFPPSDLKYAGRELAKDGSWRWSKAAGDASAPPALFDARFTFSVDPKEKTRQIWYLRVDPLLGSTSELWKEK